MEQRISDELLGAVRALVEQVEYIYAILRVEFVPGYSVRCEREFEQSIERVKELMTKTKGD